MFSLLQNDHNSRVGDIPYQYFLYLPRISLGQFIVDFGVAFSGIADEDEASVWELAQQGFYDGEFIGLGGFEEVQ